MPTPLVSFRLDPAERQRYSELAAARGLTLSEAIRAALPAFLDRKPPPPPPRRRRRR